MAVSRCKPKSTRGWQDELTEESGDLGLIAAQHKYTYVAQKWLAMAQTNTFFISSVARAVERRLDVSSHQKQRLQVRARCARPNSTYRAAVDDRISPACHQGSVALILAPVLEKVNVAAGFHRTRLWRVRLSPIEAGIFPWCLLHSVPKMPCVKNVLAATHNVGYTTAMTACRRAIGESLATINHTHLIVSRGVVV